MALHYIQALFNVMQNVHRWISKCSMSCPWVSKATLNHIFTAIFHSWFAVTAKTTLAFVKDTVTVREHNSYYTSMLAVKVALFEFSWKTSYSGHLFLIVATCTMTLQLARVTYMNFMASWSLLGVYLVEKSIVVIFLTMQYFIWRSLWFLSDLKGI